ncbi:hypothetical protein KVK21_04390 [Helicobacter pylori]|nr:hypothetical protein KVK21_04390 [Helicobacter pylori]
MQDFINGFLKAWKAWSDDGKDAFLESFLDEVKNSKNDPSNFLGILEQEIKSLSQEGLKDDISSMLEVIESMKNEISHTKDNENVSDFMNVLQNEISQGQNNPNDNPNEFVESLAQAIIETQENANKNEIELTEQKSVLEMSEDAQTTTQANESIKPQTNNTATQQENAKESQAIEQNRATQEPHAKEEPKKVSHPDEPWLDYNPKNHAGLKERQENQEKTPSKGNDEPWIEYGKLMQEKAKAHYQAMVEKERAKQQAQQNAKNTNSINTPNKEVAIIDYGYTQSAPAKSRKR